MFLWEEGNIEGGRCLPDLEGLWVDGCSAMKLLNFMCLEVDSFAYSFLCCSLMLARILLFSRHFLLLRYDFSSSLYSCAPTHISGLLYYSSSIFFASISSFSASYFISSILISGSYFLSKLTSIGLSASFSQLMIPNLKKSSFSLMDKSQGRTAPRGVCGLEWECPCVSLGVS